MTYPAYKDSAVAGEEYTETRGLPDRLTEIGKPLLVIFGEEDQIYDAREALSAYAAIPGARTRLIPDVGHSPQVEAPKATANAINTFTQNIAASQAAERARIAARAQAEARAKANRARAKANRIGKKRQQARQQKQPAQ